MGRGRGESIGSLSSINRNTLVPCLFFRRLLVPHICYFRTLQSGFYKDLALNVTVINRGLKFYLEKVRDSRNIFPCLNGMPFTSKSFWKQRRTYKIYMNQSTWKLTELSNKLMLTQRINAYRKWNKVAAWIARSLASLKVKYKYYGKHGHSCFSMQALIRNDGTCPTPTAIKARVCSYNMSWWA